MLTEDFWRTAVLQCLYREEHFLLSLLHYFSLLFYWLERKQLFSFEDQL